MPDYNANYKLNQKLVIPKKQTWLERVKATEEYHQSQLRLNDKWRMEHTATALQRSLGSISQDLKIAGWLKTHEEKISKFKTFTEAIEFVRQKELLRKRGEI